MAKFFYGDGFKALFKDLFITYDYNKVTFFRR